MPIRPPAISLRLSKEIAAATLVLAAGEVCSRATVAAFEVLTGNCQAAAQACRRGWRSRPHLTSVQQRAPVTGDTTLWTRYRLVRRM
jgi:hypothetical protein